MFDYENICYTKNAVKCEINTVFSHNNKGILLVILLEGELGVISKKETYPLEKFEVMVTSSPCEIVPVRSSKIMYVLMQGVVATEYCENVGNPFLLNNALYDFYQHKIQQIVDAVPVENKVLISGLCYSLLCDVVNDSEAVPLDYPSLVIEAMNIIHQDYMGMYGVEQLAQELDVSKEHLVRVFSKHTGTTPGQYLTKLKIKVVKQFLIENEYNLEVIASLTGFANANYMCKVFKKYTGQTPVQYRVANENKLPTKTLFGQADDSWLL